MRDTYDPEQMYRLTRKNTGETKDFLSLQDIEYTFDPVGNITQIRENASTNAARTAQYVYDESGNRLLKTNEVTGKQTVYVNEFVDIEGGNVKNHIYAGSMKVATFESGESTESQGTDPNCAPPESGDWSISTDCTFTGQAAALGNVEVQSSAVLTLGENAVLFLDLHTASQTRVTDARQ